jgi:hypothetical protein
MIKLSDATLDLFIYHLSEGLGDNEKQIHEQYEKFWSNLPATLEQLDASVELNPQDSAHIKFHKSISAHTLYGDFRRATIDDTDSLWFSSWVYVTQQLLDILPEFKTLAPKKIAEDGYLGQTWMIAGWLDTPLDFHSKAQLAKEAYETLIGKEPQYLEKGIFLGTNAFELWCGDEQWEGIETNSHVVVILYDKKSSFIEAANYYHDWRYLFYCRHKILWAYEQALALREPLLQDYTNSIPDVTNLSQKNLKELRDELQANIEALARYVGNLNRLETQQHTVRINLRHYQRKCNESFFKGVEFLTEFSRIATNKYKTQLEEDHASLRPGLSIRENLTATIRGMVEIVQAESDQEQAEREQRIEDVIALVGFGVGTASLVGTVFTPLVQQLTQPQPEKTPQPAATTQASPSPIEPAQTPPPSSTSWLPWVVFLLICLVLGGLASWVGLAWVRSRRHRSTK